MRKNKQHYSAIGLPAQNSLDFVKSAINQLNKNSIFFVNKEGVMDLYPEKIRVQRIIDIPTSYGWYEGERYCPSESNDIAMVSFTSGTEGKPKAVFISHAALSNTTQRLIDVMELDDTVREYIGVPVYHSFGFGRCRTISKVGGKFFVPEKGFDPIEISEMLDEKKINSISAVPSLLRILLEAEDLFRNSGENLKWMEIGSQYMSASEKSKLRLLFPNAKIVQHYGLTEASRTSFLKIHTVPKSRLESVGESMFGVQTKISPEGQIMIKGDHLASFIVKDDEFYCASDESGWLTTKDAGSIEDSYLYYKGRTDDIINCAGIKISPEFIEKKMRENTSVSKGFCIVKFQDPIKGEIPKLVVEKGNNIEILLSAYQDILSSHGITLAESDALALMRSLPKTDTGKIQRGKISKELSDLEKIVVEESAVEDDIDIQAKIVSIWEQALSIKPISVNNSFFDLGGDSLSAIRVSLAMEKAGIDRAVCRRIFKGESISQLVKSSLENGVENSSHTELSLGNIAINFMRGLLVLINIAAHWMPGVVERLPDAVSRFNVYLAPFYSSGTPGFAILFGVGSGFFIYPRFERNPSSVFSLIGRNAAILAVGVILLALARVCDLVLSYGAVSPMDISNSAWSVITFYFFAVLSLPVWLVILSKIPGGISEKCLLLACCLYACHIIFDHATILPSKNPFIQPFVLLLTAKFNYFEMMAGAFVGMAFGNYFRRAITKDSKLSSFISIGVVSVFIGVFLSIELNEVPLWLKWPKGLVLWSWFFYFGCVSVLTVLLYKLICVSQAVRDSLLVSLVSIFGLMAFPLFIAHEMVIPFKNILYSLDVPFSLPISMSLFIVFTVFGVRKLYRLYNQ